MNHEYHESNGPSDQTSRGSSSFEQFTDSVREAFRKGSSDAKKTFERVLPVVKQDVSKGVHDIAYAVSFATVFGGCLLRELTPQTLKDGVRDGVAAGKRSADEVIRHRKERQERESGEAPDAVSPVSPA